MLRDDPGETKLTQHDDESWSAKPVHSAPLQDPSCILGHSEVGAGRDVKTREH